jgi:uncharacterized phage protein gp47/JayE
MSLQSAISGALDNLRSAVNDTADAARNLRGATASGLDSAIGSAAAAMAGAHLESVLALAPRLPFATAESVCDSFEEALRQASDLVPTAVTALVLGGDPRVAPLIVALLADEDALGAVGAPEPPDGAAGDPNLPRARLAAGLSPAALPRAFTDGALAVGRSFAASLQGASGSLLSQGGLAQAALADVRAGVGVPEAFAGVVSSAVERVHLAATRGVNNVYAAALQQVQLLRAGRPARIFAGRAGRRVSLDRDYSGIVPGSYALLDKRGASELFKVNNAAQGSRAEFAISGKSTYLSLGGQNLSLFDSAVRETTVYARSERLKRARAPLTTPVSGAAITVAADVSGMAAGRRVIVKGPRISDGSLLVHHALLLSATPAAVAADGGTLQIDPPLPEPLRRDATVVYGNVALASHGEAVAQVLGAGNAAQSFQRFELKQAPLTYRAATTETGAASELTLRVGDVEWAERATLYGAGAAERVYALRTDEQGRVWVQFGDGERGARPASGVNNIRAHYRKGLGVDGNVRAETLTQPSVRPLGLKSVANLAAAAGGTDPEAADAARRSMPLQTRTLGRAVSVLDYEDFARAYAGVSKATAAVLQLANGPTVCVTVAGADGVALTPGNPLWVNLLAALRASGDPHVPLRLLTHAASTFRIGLKVKVDAAYDAKAVLAAVETALRSHYAFDARELGQPVQQSEVVAVVHGVPGVVALDLDFLYGGSAPASQKIKSRRLRLLATRMHVVGAQPRAAEILTLDAAPFDRLEVMP